jgi:hypothetical protein
MIIMAPTGNQKGKLMWPSLPTANHIADVANWFFIGSLVVGVVSTILIVWMAGVKETYWEKDRTESAERIALLATQGDQARAELGIAQADIAKANENALKLQLLLSGEIRKNAWRRLSKEQHDVISEAARGSLPLKVGMGFDGNDPEASMYASDLIKAFEDGGAIVNPQPSALFIGQMPVSGMIFAKTKDFDSSAIQEAFARANIPFTLNPSFRGDAWVSMSLYVGHKPQAF